MLSQASEEMWLGPMLGAVTLSPFLGFWPPYGPGHDDEGNLSGHPPTHAHLQVRLLQPVVHQLRVALLLLQLLLQLGNAGLQAPLLLQRQGSG